MAINSPWKITRLHCNEARRGRPMETECVKGRCDIAAGALLRMWPYGPTERPQCRGCEMHEVDGGRRE